MLGDCPTAISFQARDAAVITAQSLTRELAPSVMHPVSAEVIQSKAAVHPQDSELIEGALGDGQYNHHTSNNDRTSNQ